MAKTQKNEKVKKKLQNYLILNKYLCSLFGFKDIEGFRKILEDVPEGINSNKKLFYTETLQNSKISEDLRHKLDRYDENIQKYLLHINQKRDPPVVLKYFQYVATILTEIYLDKFYNEFNLLYSDYTKFVFDINKKENRKTEDVAYETPDKTYMSKLAYWSATGSGKTLLMHINFLQFLEYNKGSRKIEYDNVLLITPNERLTSQHIDELNLSSIENKRFEIQRTLDDWALEDPIKVIEISKIKKEVESKDGKSIPVEAFGKRNIVFVDEGHKGHSTEYKIWKNNRKELVENNGFTFEYSATFREIVDDVATFKEYASCIIFDYRYEYFNKDGFGKDYSILDLKDYEQYGDEYFTGALLAFYEQKIYFEQYYEKIKLFNLENPLMIFVGTSVKKDESDVFQVVKFISRFANEREYFSRLIRDILTDNSSLLDENDQPIFSSKFPYLRDKIRIDKNILNEIYKELLKKLFHTELSHPLKFIEIKNAEGEIGLKFEDNNDYFGVINIGNTNDFLKLIENDTENHYFDKNISKSSLTSKSLFGRIEKRDSQINFLIGAKKFSEGWNSYRVSSMGLLNVGKNEGAQIIQLFGRGVRLKGYDNYLKRSYCLEKKRLIPAEIRVPENISILETLNIFGLNSNYMGTFKEILKGEGIEESITKKLKIKSNYPTKTLYLPMPPEDIDFQSSSQILSQMFLSKLEIGKIKIDLSSKIEVMESITNLNQVEPKNDVVGENKIDKEIIDIIDFDEVFLELLKYKDLKGYSNLYFTKKDLQNIFAGKENSILEYSIVCKKDILNISQFEEIDKIPKIRDYVIQILKVFIDKTYTYKKSLYIEDRLSYKELSEDYEYIVQPHYLFEMSSNEIIQKDDLINFSKELESLIIEKSEESDALYIEDNSIDIKIEDRNKETIIDFLYLDIHLFQPLIYKYTLKYGNNKIENFVKISPVQLVDSERKFVILLRDYLNQKKNELNYDEIYLLRNPSRRGVHFFETKNFYPDFILWTIKGEELTISFIDPKGLKMVNPEDEKLKLCTKLKEIELDIYNRGKGKSKYKIIKLNSFILSYTLYDNLKWEDSKDDLKNKNILFLEDKLDAIDQLFKKIEDDKKNSG